MPISFVTTYVHAEIQSCTRVAYSPKLFSKRNLYCPISELGSIRWCTILCTFTWCTILTPLCFTQRIRAAVPCSDVCTCSGSPSMPLILIVYIIMMMIVAWGLLRFITLLVECSWRSLLCLKQYGKVIGLTDSRRPPTTHSVSKQANLENAVPPSIWQGLSWLT